MSHNGLFYNIETPVGKISEVVDDGEAIAFDFLEDEFRYSIRIDRVDEVFYKGTAKSQPGNELATVECEVYRHKDKTLIYGKKWAYSHLDYDMWLVEFEKEDDHTDI